MNSANRHTSNRIGSRNCTRISRGALPDCWSTVTSTPARVRVWISPCVCAPETGYAAQYSSFAVEVNGARLEVELVPAEVPPDTVPAVGVLTVISTRSSWSSSVAVAICLCSASAITRLIGSSVPWLEGPIDPSSEEERDGQSRRREREEQGELVAEHEPAHTYSDVAGRGEHGVAPVREARAHLRARGGGPRPLRTAAVARRGHGRLGAGLGSSVAGCRRRSWVLEGPSVMAPWGLLLWPSGKRAHRARTAPGAKLRCRAPGPCVLCECRRSAG